MGIIYIFTFPNGKQYVGQTVDTIKRFSSHRKRTGQVVDNAIQKYSWKNVKKELLFCHDEYLDWMEEEWIRELNSLAPDGYNLDTGGGVNRNITEIARQHLSESHKGQHSSPATEYKKGQVSTFKGKHHTEEAKIKMRKKRKDFHHTEEWKKKMSERMIGEKNSNFGKHSGKHNNKYIEKV